jgi:ABC-type sulfate/molybdate transport systems ATPase subunit
MLDAHVVKRRRSMVVDIALRVERGASVAVFGPSGAGKSTLLNCVAGLEQPDGGHVALRGVTLFPPALPLDRRSIGYLTQSADLFPHLSVAANVTFGLGGRSALEDDPWVAEMRERLALVDVWQSPASQVSGGQARRVALARMLARRPQLVLLDEPFRALDRPVVRDLIGSLVDWQQQIGFTMVAVDHDAEPLARLCPTVIAIEGGATIQRGTWRELREQPASQALERLLAPL